MVFSRGILEAHQVSERLQSEKEPLANAGFITRRSLTLESCRRRLRLRKLTCNVGDVVHGKQTPELHRLYFSRMFSVPFEGFTGLTKGSFGFDRPDFQFDSV